MKNNYLHTANTTKKSSARGRRVFFAFGVVAAVTLAGVALAAGPGHPSGRGSKSQIVAENPDASNNHDIATSGIGFRTTTTSLQRARGKKRQESNSRDIQHAGNARLLPRPRGARPAGPGTQRRRSAHNRRLSHRNPRSRTLRSPDGARPPCGDRRDDSRNLSDPQTLRDTFYGGYKSVEEIYAFLDQKVAEFPTWSRR